jgi:hypothetical protein
VTRTLLTLALLGLAYVPGLTAQEGQAGGTVGEDEVGAPAFRALRIPEGHSPIRLDGILAEEAWQRAEVMSGFRQREPFQGVDATLQTEVRVIYDGADMYVGITALDSSPDEIVSRILQRDRVLGGGGFGGLSGGGDDVVAILLDTFKDRRNAVVIATNPNGAYFDALIANDGGEVNTDWNGVWDVAATRIPGGWSAEFIIPWRSLRYADAPDQEWGFNVYRSIPRLQEESLWQAWARDGGGFNRVSQAGTLRGLEDLPPPRITVEAKPFGLASRRQVQEAGVVQPGFNDGDFGLDVKAQVTPGLVMDLTWNTDFAQVEVDDQQVNLTRFNLFFPEKREFFLENAGIFEFGQGGFRGPPPFLMFFSRQIGISPDGQVPIVGGGRLTGRAGRQTLGLLSVVTDDVPGAGGAGGVAGETFNVFRVKRDVGTAAYIGAMVTDRRGGGEAATMGGVDFQYYPHPTLETSGFAARSTVDGPGGEGWTYQGALNFTADRWGGFLSFLNIDPETTASSGFITRTDIRRTNLSIRHTLRPSILNLRRVDLRPNGEYVSGADGRFQDYEAQASVSATFNTGDVIRTSYTAAESQVDDAFEVAGVSVPAGRYGLDQWSVGFTSTSARPWQISTSYAEQDYFGGSLSRLTAGFTLIPSPAFSIATSFSENRGSLPAGDFKADIVSVRTTWALSPRIVTNALFQWNSVSDEVSANVRFNFIHRPGSDLFLVFTENRGVGDDLWALDSRGMVAKLTWLIRF